MTKRQTQPRQPKTVPRGKLAILKALGAPGTPERGLHELELPRATGLTPGVVSTDLFSLIESGHAKPYWGSRPDQECTYRLTPWGKELRARLVEDRLIVDEPLEEAASPEAAAA